LVLKSDAFERAYMVLAQTYVDKSKFDLAQDLCKKCLTYNQSFSKAHETLGSILERECAYKDAALSYEKAWEVTNQGSPQIGYELAFNYLKVRAGGRRWMGGCACVCERRRSEETRAW